MPPCVDITTEFHELVSKHDVPVQRPRRRTDEGEKKRHAAAVAWTKEARRIVRGYC